jgi:hypothetical protein
MSRKASRNTPTWYHGAWVTASAKIPGPGWADWSRLAEAISRCQDFCVGVHRITFRRIYT